MLWNRESRVSESVRRLEEIGSADGQDVIEPTNGGPRMAEFFSIIRDYAKEVTPSEDVLERFRKKGA